MVRQAAATAAHPPRPPGPPRPAGPAVPPLRRARCRRRRGRCQRKVGEVARTVGTKKSGVRLRRADGRHRFRGRVWREKPGGSSASAVPVAVSGSARAPDWSATSARLWNGCRPAPAAACPCPPTPLAASGWRDASRPAAGAAGPARDASVIVRSTRCAHDVGSIAISRAIGANATNDACNVNEPDDGALTTNDPSAPEDEASRVRPSPSRSVTTTPGNGWRDAVTEPRTVQPEGACAPGMAGWSTAAHVRHVLHAIARLHRVRLTTTAIRIRGGGRGKV